MPSKRNSGVRHPCHLCSKTFSRKHDLPRHLETHDPATLLKHICPHCDHYATRQESNFRNHMKARHGIDIPRKPKPVRMATGRKSRARKPRAAKSNASIINLSTSATGEFSHSSTMDMLVNPTAGQWCQSPTPSMTTSEFSSVSDELQPFSWTANFPELVSGMAPAQEPKIFMDPLATMALPAFPNLNTDFGLWNDFTSLDLSQTDCGIPFPALSAPSGADYLAAPFTTQSPDMEMMFNLDPSFQFWNAPQVMPPQTTFNYVPFPELSF